MTDITICESEECPKRKECHRHEAQRGKYQSVCTFCTDFSDGQERDWFMPMEDAK